MKKIYLICQFYYKSIIALILITIVMTVACFSMLYTVGVVKHVKYMDDMFEKIIPENSYCVTFPAQIGESMDETFEQQQYVLEQLQKNPLIDSLFYMQHSEQLTDNNAIVNILLYNDNLWDRYCSVINKKDISNKEESMPIQYIAAEPIFGKGADDEIVSLRSVLSGLNGEYLEFHVVAEIGHPYFIPAFLTSGNFLSANDFFDSGNLIVVHETKDTLSKLQGITQIYPCSSFFIVFREDITTEEKELLIQTLEKSLYVETVSEIRKNTEAVVDGKLSKALPLPFFMLTVSTAAFLSLSVLLLHKKEKEAAIYYLCGSSRKKGFMISFCALGVPGVLATFFNILFVVIYPHFLRKGIINFNGVLFDIDSIQIVLIYLVCVISICIILPLIQQYKKSEIDIFRRK